MSNKINNINKIPPHKKNIHRHNGRAHNELRPLSIQRKILPHAMGSSLISLGNTRVLCSASILEGIPSFIKNTESGWLTAEYGMLPAATHVRNEREAIRGQSGRTKEIQRLIGRSLRAALNLNMLGKKTIKIDCDVISADGSTRTASITGAYIALFDALTSTGIISPHDREILKPIAAVSVGMLNGNPMLDLDYEEDSKADSDLNIVMNSSLNLIEIQGTAEGEAYSKKDLNEMISLAEEGIIKLLAFQQDIFKK